LEELARTLLNEIGLPKYFWADAVSTTSYVLNRLLIRPILKKTPYELFKGRKPNISSLKVFGCKCFILNKVKITWANLILKKMKVSSLVIHCMLMHIEHTIREPC